MQFFDFSELTRRIKAVNFDLTEEVTDRYGVKHKAGLSKVDKYDGAPREKLIEAVDKHIEGTGVQDEKSKLNMRNQLIKGHQYFKEGLEMNKSSQVKMKTKNGIQSIKNNNPNYYLTQGIYNDILKSDKDMYNKIVSKDDEEMDIRPSHLIEPDERFGIMGTGKVGIFEDDNPEKPIATYYITEHMLDKAWDKSR